MEATQSKKIVSIALFYLLAMIMGVAWTLVPSLSTFLTDKSVVGHLTSREYGSLELFLVIPAILSSTLGGVLGKKVGIKNVLQLGVVCGFLAMTFLGASAFAMGSSWNAYYLLIFSALFIGYAIGSILTGLNVFLALYFPHISASILTGMYAFLGLGSAISPLFLELTREHVQWWLPTGIIALLFLVLLCLISICILPLKKGVSTSRMLLKQLPKQFWLFILIAFIYAQVESLFAIWGPIYVHSEKHLSISQGSYGLALFWGGSTITQFLISSISWKISPKIIYYFLNCVIIIAVFGMLFVESDVNIMSLFLLGGIGISSYYALSVNFIEKRYVNFAEIASGIMVTGYFLGIGISSLLVGYLLELKHLTLSNIVGIVVVLSVCMFVIAYFSTREISSLGKRKHN